MSGPPMKREAGERPARTRHCIRYGQARGLRKLRSSGHWKREGGLSLSCKPGDLPADGMGLATSDWTDAVGDRAERVFKDLLYARRLYALKASRADDPVAGLIFVKDQHPGITERRRVMLA